MTSQPGKQTITIYTLSNLSGSKGNQKMKFSRLVGYNKRNFFLEKNTQIWWINLSQNLF